MSPLYGRPCQGHLRPVGRVVAATTSATTQTAKAWRESWKVNASIAPPDATRTGQTGGTGGTGAGVHIQVRTISTPSLAAPTPILINRSGRYLQQPSQLSHLSLVCPIPLITKLRTDHSFITLQIRRVLQTYCNSAGSQSFFVTHYSPCLSRPSRLSQRPSTCLPQAAMASTTQTRSHGDHKHGHGHHHHHHDNAYLTSSNKNDAGVRITRIGLFSNLGMAIAKGVGGYMFNSKAMVADAIHSVTDLASDIMTLATISWSLRPPTDKYPTGFGKIESLGSLGVSSMLLIGGMYMGYGSLLTLYGHFFLDPSAAAELMEHVHTHSHSHGHGHDEGEIVPSLHAAWLAAGTVAIKEWLYHASKLFLRCWVIDS